jgi:hypothetical protein
MTNLRFWVDASEFDNFSPQRMAKTALSTVLSRTLRTNIQNGNIKTLNKIQKENMVLFCF